MPLIKSPKKEAVSKNIKAEMHAGKPRKQSIAIALSVQRAAKKRKHMAEGGEIKAASMKPDVRHEPMHDADHAKDKQELEMLRRHVVKLQQELDARKESMSGSSIDHAKDPMEMDMLDGHSTHHGEEKQAGSEMHHDEDESDAMEMDMMHKKALFARSGVAAAIRHKHRMAEGGSVPEKHDDDYQVGEEGSIGKKITKAFQEGAKSLVDKIRGKKKMMAEGGEVDLQENADEHLNLEDQLSYNAARKKTYFDDSQISKQPMDSNLHGDEREHEAEDEHDMVGSIRKKMKSIRR